MAEVEEIVSLQLGSKINNLHSVIKRCKYGYPMAIQSLPYKKEKGELLPFPTTFWLTCPYLKHEIGTLESRGYIEKAKKLLENDEVRKAFIESREKTVKIRLSMVDENFKYYKHLSKLGIGGSKNDLLIKCLHLHVANYFKTKINPIGKWVLNELKDIECDDCKCCKLSSK